MTVLFCCQASRHVRNLIIYSIICVPGYYYNKFPPFPVIVFICMVTCFFLIWLVYYIIFSDIVIPNIVFASLHFLAPFKIRWDHGDQFWPKIVRGMLFVIFRLTFCKGLLPIHLLHVLESGSPLSCLQHSPCASAGDVLWPQNTLWYLKLQRIGGYCLYRRHQACPD